MQATPRAEHQEVLGAPSVHLDQQLPDNADCPQPVGNTSYLQAHPSARLVLKSESAPTSSESVRRQPDPQVRPSKLKQTTLSHFNLAKPLPLSAGTSVEVVPEAPTASPIQVFALEQDAESSTSVQAAAVETLKPDARPLQTTVLNISSDQEKSPASLNSDSAPTLSVGAKCPAVRNLKLKLHKKDRMVVLRAPKVDPDQHPSDTTSCPSRVGDTSSSQGHLSATSILNPAQILNVGVKQQSDYRAGRLSLAFQ